MIFVPLGTQKFQFNRLLKYVDELIEEKVITEDVFAQIGNSTYLPKNYKYVNFLESADFNKKLDSARVVITHAGVGSILSSLKRGKITIVVPRSEKGEHVDNHQIQIAQKYAELGFVLMANSKQELADALNNKMFVSKYEPQQSCVDKICGAIVEFIETTRKDR